jgi:hypothetical protein
VEDKVALGGKTYSIIDVKFEGGIGVVVAMVGKDVEEGSDEGQGGSCHVRDEEYGADALRNELGLERD